jgi:serine/threonine protein kinase
VSSSFTLFLECVRKSGLLDPTRFEEYLQQSRAASALPADPVPLADALIRDGLLTRFQADQLLRGKYRNFVISGKYKLLERLGSGGMGKVFLCEHKVMRRRVAIKVLPASQAQDPSALERFHREARAAAQLHHANIVTAHDIDQDGKLHFLVMEYVDGSNLEQIVRRHGGIDPERAAHYIRQAAQGLQHAHEAGLVHRDVKPANLIVDRAGTVKVLDMGLARFFHDEADTITRQYDARNVLGTADFLAPEQALDSHNVDIRADIYSLGMTFYFLLTGTYPFPEGSVAQKLMWHQLRQPRPIRDVRPDVPEGLAAIVMQMMAKKPEQRYQTPAEVVDALAPWTATPIPPPSAEEMPELCLAARGSSQSNSGALTRSAAALAVAAAAPTQAGKSAPVASGPGSGATDSTVVQGLASPLAGTAVKTPKPDQAIRQSQTAGSMSSRAPSPATSATPAKGSAVRRADSASRPVPVPIQPEKTPRRASRLRQDPAGFRFVWRPKHLWLVAAAACGLMLIVAVSFGLLWAFSRSRQTAAVRVPAPESKPQPEAPPTPDGPRPAPPGTDVAITLVNGARRVQTPHYEAVVEVDGCLNSLRIDGVELLSSGVKLNEGKSVSRGSYFYFDRDGHQGAVKLPNIEQPAANVIKASGDKFSIQYEFSPNTLSWKITNATDNVVPFFIILDSAAVNAVINGQGEVARVPVERRPDAALENKWQSTTWFAGRAKLTISGGTRVWGPFGEGNSQVWEASLHDYETRELVLKVGNASDAELAKTALLSGERRIQTPQYEAVVAEDGCLPTLRVDGVEFLKPGVDISRGIYLYQNGTLKLPAIEQPAENLIIAKGEKASLRYDFGPDAITLTATNATDQGMPLYIVFHPAVTAVATDKGEWEKTTAVTKPADPPEKWRTTTWFAGDAKLRITAGTKVWGPWNGLQVWEASLAPRETRKVVLEVGVISQAEAVKIAAVTGKPVERTDLLLQVPKDYQVFQRRSRLRGQITVEGRVRRACDQVEVRLLGKSLAGALPDQWQVLPVDRQSRQFAGTLPTNAGGWYKVEIRALKDQQVVAQTVVDHVGVGEVFVGAGQSNSTNCAPERLQQHSGMVASFSGTDWQLADDPQPGVHDGSAGGSYWPAFGDALYARYHVPIGIASTGHSGTSVSQWQPNGELFRWMATRMHQLGRDGFRAVLWHQGESDVGMAAEEYARRLTSVIQGSKRAAGWEFPWFVAQVSYHNPTNTSFPNPRKAQKQLWETGIALEGPDTDTLTGDNRDNGGQGIHFSPKGLRAHGQLWADKVGVYLEKVLTR